MTQAQGQLFIISAPSGAGKTSLVNALTEHLPDVQVSISHTTRPQRPGEQDGINYHFVSHQAFAELDRQGVFLEQAEVFGNRYGTSRLAVEACLRAGQDVILEIDWQGARLVREVLPRTVSIFILPPSRAALLERLTRRGQDSEAVIAGRMEKAVAEMSHYAEYDYLLVNDRFDQALAELESIFVAERLVCQRQQQQLDHLLQDLLG